MLKLPQVSTPNINAAGETIQGLEFEIKWRPVETVLTFFNSTHILDSEDRETKQDLEYIIDNSFNFGITYNPIERVTLTSSNQYRSDWGPADSYFVSNAAVYYTPPFLNDKLELQFIVENLFDEDYDYPEVVRRNLDTVPNARGPQAIWGGVSYSF